MNKYHRVRDTRRMVEGVTTGRRLSVTIDAASGAEADELFEARWEQLESGHDLPAAPTLPLISNQSLRDQFMAPGALEIKRRTPAFSTPGQ